MKSKNVKLSIFIVIIVIIMLGINALSISPINLNSITKGDTHENNNPNNLLLSDYWTENDVPYIYIKDDNWSDTGYINLGDGTSNNPHKIENITLNGVNSPNQICVLIENSTEPFIIFNCTVYNGTTGIKLSETNNGILLNNTCTDNEGYGISLDNCFNNTIRGNNVTLSEIGIYILMSEKNELIENTIDNNQIQNSYGINVEECNNGTIEKNNVFNSAFLGIFIFGATNFTLSQNNMQNCGIGVSTDDDSISKYKSNQIDESNKVNTKSVYYYVNETGLNDMNFTNAGEILLYYCNNSMISGIDISYCSMGIYLKFCNNISIENCNISYSYLYAVYVYTCLNVSIINNIINNNIYYGFYIYSNNVTLRDNTILNNGRDGINSNGDNNTFILNVVSYNGQNGINIDDGQYNNIFNNDIDYNSNIGLYLNENANFTTVFNNSIKYNSQIGLSIDFETKNITIYYNFFIDNGINALDNGTNNKWHNGTHGNYWSDYVGIDENPCDGIGDSPYSIGGNPGNIDPYPLFFINNLNNGGGGGVPDILGTLLITTSVAGIAVITTVIYLKKKRK